MDTAKDHVAGEQMKTLEEKYECMSLECREYDKIELPETHLTLPV